MFNDLTLNSQACATRQCELKHTPYGYHLEDLSGNGTMVNGETIVQKKLDFGDTLEFEELQITLCEIEALRKESSKALKTKRISNREKPQKTGKLMFKRHNKKCNLLIDTPQIIGSSDEAHIVIDDDYLSAFHCQLIPHNNGMILRDLTSTNGTWINDIRIMEVFLSDSCKFKAGKTEFRFSGKNPEKQIEQPEGDFFGMIGRHPKLLAVQNLIKRMAPLNETILITGETGTGKELSAYAVHMLSERSEEPFIAVNCAAISADLIESELFGHVEGAFTGATKSRKGAFEEAGQGTVFLDEIGELPLSLQPKLLRTLDSGEIKPVGSSFAKTHKARIVAATNRNLAEEVKAGRFREDLYYRLAAMPVELPALRERREDIPELAGYFLSQADNNVELSKSAENILTYNYWPGNIRQLRNVITTSLMYHPEAIENGILEEEHLIINGPGSVLQKMQKSEVLYKGQTLKDAEAQLIMEAMKEYGGNKQMVSKALGISKSALYDKIKKYDIT